MPIRVLDNVAYVTYNRQGSFMAIKTDGSLWGWGFNTEGSLGVGLRSHQKRRAYEPVRIMDNVAYVTMGGLHTLAITADGDLWTWGSNWYGQIGNGTRAQDYWSYVTAPTRIMGDVVAVAATNNTSAAITSSGNLYTWGSNEFGQLGRAPGTEAMFVPGRVPGMTNMASLYAGFSQFLALDRGGSLWGWGWNLQGLMGNGEYGPSAADVTAPIMILDNVQEVSRNFGWGRVAVLRNDGSLWAWGRNRPHALRMAEQDPRPNPEQILDNAVAFSIGDRGSIALRSDGSLLSLTSVGDRHTYRQIAEGVRVPSSVHVSFQAVATQPAQAALDLSTAGPWAHEGITRAIEFGLVPPSLQGAYGQPITRAEFAALAVKLYESIRGEITGRVAFADTNDVNVQKMAYLGVVGGVGDNRFNPDGQLTREQAAAMLSRLADALGWPLINAEPNFTDFDNISAWAIGYVGQMQVSGIMGGVGDGRFAPGDAYTREQSIITILRMLE